MWSRAECARSAESSPCAIRPRSHEWSLRPALDSVDSTWSVRTRFFTPGMVESMPEETWGDVLDIDLTGIWRTIRVTVPAVKCGGGGAIVITGSTSASRGAVNSGHCVAPNAVAWLATFALGGTRIGFCGRGGKPMKTHVREEAGAGVPGEGNPTRFTPTGTAVAR